MPKSLFTTLRNISKETLKSAGNHNISLHGAAIAFYTIFSIAPLIIIILALAAFLLGEHRTTGFFVHYLDQLLGNELANNLITFTSDAQRQTSGLIASVVAVFLLLFGATRVITQLKDTLNTIWGIANPKISSIKLYFINRALALVMILILTGLFIASLILEGGINFFSGLFLPYIPTVFLPLLKAISSLLSIGMTIIFFTLLFKVLPDVHARWKDIFVGSCATTILFLVGKYAIAFYLGSDSMQAGYKAAGTFVVFLIWIFYNVQIMLLGAEFTQVYTKRFGKNLRTSRNAEFIATN